MKKTKKQLQEEIKLRKVRRMKETDLFLEYTNQYMKTCCCGWCGFIGNFVHSEFYSIEELICPRCGSQGSMYPWPD